ncbi:exosortase F system-associated membrane protein [Flavobacterium subsaxonicum]|uniref:Exosortase n=1 Tax=Flavobacterium subsaxonicum WB 4.1-42 = DSM 21790 TaxID=1121898 RepID=A0A0A2MRP2_9FLAO|nr:exosortase F system-associated protein [Flavobacterium subsaxonicum]KGO94231.1 hypothetical protein Q766_04715 [Flavobacterium subsaxonicum WB 4.1-42 = DSM 21790]
MQKVNIKSALAITVLLVLLVSVRIFEQKLFYDPLLNFFKFGGKVIPKYNGLKLFLGLTFRYVLNTALSLGIIWFCFKDKSVLKLTTLLYVIFFVVLIGIFFVLLNTSNPSLMLLFYIRRFIIQPLFLILFVPAFYYQKRVK